MISATQHTHIYQLHIDKPQYQISLASPINRLLDPHSHSPDRIRTIDAFFYAEETERMRKFIAYNDSAFKLFIEMVGQHFERSPNERKTQVPLMILTETESILLRRIRRLKKLQKDEYSSRDSSSSGVSFSKSYMPRSSCQYLQSRLSQKEISELSEFKSSLLEEGSNHQIFDPQFSSNQSQLNLLRKRASEHFNEWLLLSGIKRLSSRLEDKDIQLVQTLKQTHQADIKHLIIGQMSDNEERPQSLCRREYDHFDQPNNPQNGSNGLRHRQLPAQIRRRVQMQLCKYNVVGSVIESFSSSLLSGNKKKVRQKAEEMLIGMEHLR